MTPQEMISSELHTISRGGPITRVSANLKADRLIEQLKSALPPMAVQTKVRHKTSGREGNVIGSGTTLVGDTLFRTTTVQYDDDDSVVHEDAATLDTVARAR